MCREPTNQPTNHNQIFRQNYDVDLYRGYNNVRLKFCYMEKDEQHS